MEGHAKISSFDHIGMDPKTAPILAKMRNADGSPRVCEQVWVSYLTGRDNGEEGVGQMTAGFGSRRDPKVLGEKIGPEFTFGIYMQEQLNEPILIIKTAWGGKSLYQDFRPPSAGPYMFNEKQLEQIKKQEKDLAALKAESAEKDGRYYRYMRDHVKKVLGDITRVCPAYDEAAGYELAGFVWFQGWNDMVNSGVYPTRDQPGGYDAYSEVLAHFIRDVRKDFDAPKMPFVIGVMGTGGPVADYGDQQKRYAPTHQNFRDAMAAPASLPEFKGNVHAVLTETCWDPELDVVAEKNGQVNALAKKLRSEGTLSRAEQEAAVDALRKELLTPRDVELLKGITNADYHYKGSGKIMALIGKAFAEALATE